MQKRLALFGLFLTLLCTQALAQVRNVYGYIYGLPAYPYWIASINLKDVNTGITYGAHGWGWGFPNSANSLRWYRNYLPSNRWYRLKIVAIDGRTREGNVFVPLGWWDFKFPDVYF